MAATPGRRPGSRGRRRTASARRPGNGLTLAELLVVVIIVGVLASLAAISGRRQLEGQNRREARSLLRMIYAAERTYRFEHPLTGYLACVASPCASVDWTALGLDNITAAGSDVRLDFDVTVPGGALPNTKFTATATYTGDASGNSMNVNETGVIDDTAWPF